MQIRLFLFFLVGLLSAVHGQPLRIAVAANTSLVIGELQADFQKKTAIRSEAVIGSSGKLAAQIINGAPFDIFLSADMAFPEKVYTAGFALTKPSTYATGSLIICSKVTGINLSDWPALLASNQINKIVVANPDLAPYGKAAVETLHHYQLWDKITSKIVYGESIGQVNTYLTTGAVQVGFTTEALIHEKGMGASLTWTAISRQAYAKIRQGVVICSYASGKRKQEALLFVKYLSSPAAQTILRHYGYLAP